jgi:hypothetical protein
MSFLKVRNYLDVISQIAMGSHGCMGEQVPKAPTSPSFFLCPDAQGIKKKPGDDLLSHGLFRSTIGAEGLNFRVRNGNGWDPFAIVTRQICICLHLQTADAVKRLYPSQLSDSNGPPGCEVTGPSHICASTGKNDLRYSAQSAPDSIISNHRKIWSSLTGD